MAAFVGDAIYYAYFKNRDLSVTYKVEIKKASYTGAAAEIPEMGEQPVIHRHLDVEGSYIQGSELVFNFISRKADFDVYDTIAQGGEFDFKVTIYDNADTTKPLWSGFILPSETSRGYFNNITVFSITATDYLSKLKTIKFSDDSGAVVSGRYTPEQVIAWCLNKIPDFEYFSVMVNMFETHMAFIFRSPLGRCYISAAIFSYIKNGIREVDNCYDVITQILQIFNSRLCTPLYNLASYPADGHFYKYVIKSNDESYSANWLNRYTGGAVTNLSYGSYQSLIDIDLFSFSLESELSRKNPVTSIELKQHNFDRGIDVTNDNFYNVTQNVIWTSTGFSYLSSSGATISMSAINQLSVTLRSYNKYLLQSDYNNSFIRIAFTLNNFTAYSGVPTETLYCKVYIYKYNVALTAIIDTKVDTLPGVNPGAYLNFVSAPSSIYQIQDGYSYKIQLEFGYANNYGNMDFNIQNFQFTSYFYANNEVLDNVSFDEIYSGYTDAGAQPQMELETKLGDSRLAGNDSSITYDTNELHLTSEWFRYGIIERRSIQYLLMQALFNMYNGSPRILKLKLYDIGDTISLRNKISLESRIYKILDIEKELKTGVVSLRMQSIATGADVAFTLIKKTLPTSSTGSGVAGGTTSDTGTQVLSIVHKSLLGLDTDDHPQYLLRTDYEPGGGGGVTPLSVDITLTAAGWSALAQTVECVGIAADSVVFVGAPVARAQFIEFGDTQISCVSSDIDSLTFNCSYAPTIDIEINILIYNY